MCVICIEVDVLVDWEGWCWYGCDVGLVWLVCIVVLWNWCV